MLNIFSWDLASVLGYTKNYLLDNKIKDKQNVEENLNILSNKNESAYSATKKEFDE